MTDPKADLRLVETYSVDCLCGVFTRINTAVVCAPWWWRWLLGNFIYTHRARCLSCGAWVGTFRTMEWVW